MLSVDEWIVKLEGMYENVRSCVWVCKSHSNEFEVKFGVHKGTVLSPLLFIIVLDRASLPDFTRKRVMLWTKAVIEDWN